MIKKINRPAALVNTDIYAANTKLNCHKCSDVFRIFTNPISIPEVRICV